MKYSYGIIGKAFALMRKIFFIPIFVLLASSMISRADAQTAAAPDTNVLDSYVQDLIETAGSAAGAVACGFRPAAWGKTFHDKMVGVIMTHAGSPGEADAHVPSQAEQNAGLAALSSAEKENIDDVKQSMGMPQKSFSYCPLMKTSGELDVLDDEESGARPLWP
jgi:hypothetical protein